MTFLNLWAAAAVAAVVIPALLILYFLKLRRREQVVSSTLLWKRAVQDLQVNAPFQRLRKNLLLFLQLAVLAAAILALARPIVKSAVADADRVVILLDRSASMNAREGDETRLDQAKEQAIRLVRTLNQRAGGWTSFFSLAGAQARTQIMVIAFSDRATIVSPFTTSVTDLTDLIRGVEPTDGRTDLREAVALAEAYLAPPTRTTDATPVSAASPAKLVLISDGRVANLAQLAVRSGALELLRVGQARDNAGLTALRTRRSYEQPDRVEVFLAVRNFGPDPATTDVSLYVDGTLRAVQPLELASAVASERAAPASAPAERDSAGDARSLVMPLILDRSAVVEARLSRADALSADNSAFAVVPPPRKQRVLVVSDGKYPFLDSVLRGLPLQEFPFVSPGDYRANTAEYETEGQSKFDVVIFDRFVPDELPSGNFIFLGAIPKVVGIEPGEKVETHPLIWWNETHPVLRHVALDYVFVAESRAVTLPAAAEVLVEGPRGPVLFRYADGARQYLVLTFAVEQSTWVRKLSFPVFVYNAIRYLGGESESEGEPLRPGDPLRVPFPPNGAVIQLVCPDNRRVSLTADAGGQAYFGGTDRVGVYRADGGVPGRDRFAVNLEDDQESDIVPPAGPLKLGGGAAIGELAAIQTATPEVWRWFIGVAFVLVLFEWWVYNRRVML
jgi:hypothetical protein